MNAKILLPILPVALVAATTNLASLAPLAPPSSAPLAATDEARAFTLTYRQTLQVGPRAPSAVDLVVTWSTLLLDARTVAVDVTAARVSPGGPTMPAPAELDTTLLLHLDAEGALEALTFAPSTSPITRSFLRALAAGAQVTLRPGAQDGWSAREQDATGVYRATYGREGARLTRDKTAYLALATADVRPDAVHLTGRALAELDARGQLAALDSTDEIRTHLGQDAPAVTAIARTTLALRAPAPPCSLARIAALRAHGEREPVLMRPDAAATQRDLDLAAVQGAAFDDLTDDLAAALAEPDAERRGRRVGKLLPVLGAAIRLDPSAAARAAARATAPGAPLGEVDALAGALAAAGNRESARALESMLRDGASLDVRAHAAVSLALSPTVDDATVVSLEAAAADPALRDTAHLALGAVAQHLGPDADRDPVAALLEQYAAATGDERRVLLAALANSGDPRIVSLMDAALASPDPDTAAAGAYGLRFVRTPEVDARLGELLARSPLTDVRIAAARAIAHRDLAAWQERLAAALAGERDEAVRAVIAGLIQPAR